VAGFLAERGYVVRVNEPYQGGDLVRTFGDPARHRHSIQLEINRALYINEETFDRLPRFATVREDLAMLAEALANVVRV
jgi:N-formylglutamate deformylase